MSYWGSGNGVLMLAYAFAHLPLVQARRPSRSKPSFHDSAIFLLSTASLKRLAPELSAFSSSSVPSLHPF